MRQTETLTVNMGPQHPSTHGVLRLVVELDGEIVQSVKPVIGYLHTGCEKEMEDQRYIQAVTITDRTDYLNNMGNELGFCLSVERLANIEPPTKGKYLRVIFAELERISSHLVWLGTHVMDLGATTVLLYCFREREAILDLKEIASGVRLMTSFIRPGGLRNDVPPEFYDGYERDGQHIMGVREFIADFPRRVDDYEALLTDNPIFRERTTGVGVISGDDALDMCLSGPALRASGVPYDVRKALPYCAYDEFEFVAPLGKNGDVFDRYCCRVRELRESARIVEQALARIDALPDDAPVNSDDRDYVPPPKEELAWSMESLIRHFKIWTEGIKPPAGEAYVPVESPRGEKAYYIVSDGSNTAIRVHERGPSFYNLQSVERLAKGHMIADLVACLGSLDPVLGEIDR